MKKIFIILTAILLTSLCLQITYGEDGSMKKDIYYLGTNDRITAYIPKSTETDDEGTIPMVLNLHWTSGTPEDQVTENGWLEVAKAEVFIIIAPLYGSYDSVYNHTDYFASIVKDAFIRYPMIDKSRVYVTGFSNGGAASVALTDQYPELFAAIAPEGWMVGMRDWSRKGAEYDMPFQIIQGSNEYTSQIPDGGMAIMSDEQAALRDLMLFNEMIDIDSAADYQMTPYWGYPANDTETLQYDGKDWAVSNYYKEGYSVPFGQLILVQDGIHWARRPHAELAWNFMKNFRRNENGEIEMITNASERSISEEQRVIARYQAVQQAMIDRDIETLDEIILDGTIFRHMTGLTQTKDEYFADIRDGRLDYQSYTMSDASVAINGNDAYLSAIVVLTANAYGAQGNWPFNVNAHLIKINGGWYMTN